MCDCQMDDRYTLPFSEPNSFFRLVPSFTHPSLVDIEVGIPANETEIGESFNCVPLLCPLMLAPTPRNMYNG